MPKTAKKTPSPKEFDVEEFKGQIHELIGNAENRIKKEVDEHKRQANELIDEFIDDHKDKIDNLKKTNIGQYIFHILTFLIATAAHIIA